MRTRGSPAAITACPTARAPRCRRIRPLLTQESPISDAWKQKLLTLQEGDVFLNKFSPTGFYSSAVNNGYIQELRERSEHQVAYTLEPVGEHTALYGVGPRKRTVYLTPMDLGRAERWVRAGRSIVRMGGRWDGLDRLRGVWLFLGQGHAPDGKWDAVPDGVIAGGSRALDTDRRGAKPVVPPGVTVGTALRHRVSIVVCARWETAGITEWLSYNASIGFDHVYLYCNDDDPTELYREVLPFLSGPSPFVTFLHFPHQGEQRRMYMHFLRTELCRSDWIAFIDVDEFLYLPRESNINAYLARVGGAADVLYFNWLMFGNNGHSERPEGSVLENYNKHENTLHPYTKVLVRTSAVNLRLLAQDPGHFWHDWPNTEGNLRRLNVLGESVDGYYDDFPHRAAAQVRQPGMLEQHLAEGLICHFFMKSEADFDRRVERSVVGEFSAQASWGEHKRLGQHKSILDGANAVEFNALRDYWRRYRSAETIPSVAPALGSINLAHGKAATQSSVSAWSLNPTADADAAGAVSGRFTGSFQFHTAEEDEPWWQVDFGGAQVISEVWIYNRLNVGQQRVRRFMISISDDGQAWVEAFRKVDDGDFGGMDGFPFRWVSKELVSCRYVRISLIGRGVLHLDQVEVFGTPTRPQAEPSGS